MTTLTKRFPVRLRRGWLRRVQAGMKAWVAFRRGAAR